MSATTAMAAARSRSVEFPNRAPHIYGSSIAGGAPTTVTILAKDKRCMLTRFQ
jgi:hypothetical protein